MEPEMTGKTSHRLSRSPARALPAALAIGALCLLALPAQAQLAVSGPGLPSSVTPTNGESLWSIVSGSFNAIPTAPGLDAKNSGLRGYVIALGGGTESVFSLGELNPSFGGSTAVFPSISVSGSSYSLIDTADPSRDVTSLQKLVIGWVAAASGPGGQSSIVNLSGLTNSAGSYDLAALQALPSRVVTKYNTTPNSSYTGVSLSAFVDTSMPGSVNSQVVRVTATDGYTVAFSLAELKEHPDDILAYSGPNLPGSAGFARAIIPLPDSTSGHKLGRWVSNVDSVTVELASPGPTPGAGLASLGLLLLVCAGVRGREIAAALRGRLD
jgi:hypothetical protein